MNQRPARVAAIHDLSGFGRCSLSVILPTLSTMGVQVCSIPTAILSSHTGGLGDVEFRDQTSFIPASLEHYKRLGLEFECVYTGFLGSEEQIDHCLEYFSAYPQALAVVDPVMGDHGKAYRTYTEPMRNRLSELVQVADVITPNLTEACMLLKIPYISDVLTRVQARSLLAKLSELGPNDVVSTGVQLATGEMANIGYGESNKAYAVVCCE